MESYLDIPYSEFELDARQSLDLYLPRTANASSPLLVFIHGGAWRSESKSDLRTTLIPSLLAQTQHPLAILEYRLAPTHPHPAQMIDVLAGLKLLASTSLLTPELEANGHKWDRKKLYLVGHSAGAFMAASVVLSRPVEDGPGDFEVDVKLRAAIKGVICVDGIYDLSSLITEYPDYRGFVTEAFGEDEGRWRRESPGTWEWKKQERGAKVLVVHSKEDDLLSLRQPNEFIAHLRTSIKGNDDRTVDVDFETLRGSHDDLLRRTELPRLIADWVANSELP